MEEITVSIRTTTNLHGTLPRLFSIQGTQCNLPNLPFNPQGLLNPPDPPIDHLRRPTRAEMPHQPQVSPRLNLLSQPHHTRIRLGRRTTKAQDPQQLQLSPYHKPHTSPLYLHILNKQQNQWQ